MIFVPRRGLGQVGAGVACWYRPVLLCSAWEGMRRWGRRGGLDGAIPVEGSWSSPKEATGDME